jgi:hypothetical protein
MADEFLKDRGRALEEEFFARESRQLLERLREKQSSDAKKAMLEDATGISDDVILDHFVELDLSAETLAALALAPLVQVAWADGTLERKEREAVLASTRRGGTIVEGGTAHRLLEDWLTHRPGERLFEAWREYASALVSAMDRETKKRFREDLLGRARYVAEAAGGVVGVGTVSRAERDVLTKIEQALA